MRPEIRKIVREMTRKGWAWSFQGNGHPSLTHPSGRFVSLSLTPGDRNAAKCIWRDIARVESAVDSRL